MPIRELSKWGRQIRSKDRVYLFDDFSCLYPDRALWNSGGESRFDHQVNSNVYPWAYGVERYASATADGGRGCFANTTSSFTFSVAKHATVKWRMIMGATDATWVRIGLSDSSPTTMTNYICFLFQPGTDSHWLCESSTTAGGAVTSATSITPNTSWTVFDIICVSSSDIRYLINNVEVGVISTAASIPTVNLMPFAWISQAGTVRYIYVDYVEAYGERD